FKISHLGYSWLLGRFNEFEGNFSYDEKSPESSKVSVTINTASVDSNHAERDKHLRSDDFLDVKKYPKASFNSTSYTPMGNGKAKVTGDLTLHGVTRSVDIDVTEVGHGDDPWGGYRRGFYGKTTLALKDYNIKMDLGPASREVELFLSVEGIRKK
ncbi:MAG: YceI family protein, partial [Chromatiales bacterium]|nr:YceI family protein [Chromatiales bacterium]